MPTRTRRARLLIPLLALSLLVPIQDATAAAAGFPSAGDPAGPLQPRHLGVLGQVLRGGLADLADAAGAGRLPAGRLSGLVHAQGPTGAEVGVSMQVAPGAVDAVNVALARLGGRVANRDGASLEAYVPAAALEALAATPGVTSASPIIAPMPLGVVSPAATLHGAEAWQAAGYMGAGVKVGVIDGGFIGISSRLGGVLPTSVHARCYVAIGSYSSRLSKCEAGTDHGTAVAESIAQMAPDVSLWVADPLSLQDFKSTVSWMTSNGVRIINSSLGFAFAGPGDGSDPTKASIYTVVNQAVSDGALWVNASGNSGESGWVGPWSDANGNRRLDFAPGDDGNSMFLEAGESIVATMRWNDPWGHSANDYDLYLSSPYSTTPVASSTDGQSGSGDPVESFAYTADVAGDYTFSIVRHAGAAVSRIQLLVLTTGESPLQHQTLADTLPSPADSANPGEISVGAVDVLSPATIEPYSSRGPTVDGRIKPDLVAGDCAPTTVEDPFCGTSQSAPFVAGAAALVLQANPSFTTAKLVSWLRGHAVPLGSTIPNGTFGWGRLALGRPVLPPTGVAFSTQPGGGAAAGLPLPVQPAVAVVDATRGTVTSGDGATSVVSLALANNPGGATLSCTGGLSRAAVHGVATFSGCMVSAKGSGYTIVASSPGLASATSARFDVAAPPRPVLVFDAVPVSGATNVPLAPETVVRVTYGHGTTFSTGPASTTPITLAVAGGSPGASLTCSGGLTRQPIAGVAVFDGCIVHGRGAGGYVLTASASGADPATSPPFVLAQGTSGPASRLTISSDASAILWGTAAPISVRLDDVGGGVDVAGRPIRFEASANGVNGWVTIAEVTTDADGTAALAYRPATNLYYRAYFDGAVDLAGSGDGPIRVTVRQLAVLRPTHLGKIATVAAGSTTVFTTTVRPARVNVPPGRVTFQVWRRTTSGWTLFESHTVQPGSDGRATFAVTWTSGSWYVRSRANPTHLNANSFWTPPERFEVP